MSKSSDDRLRRLEARTPERRRGNVVQAEPGVDFYAFVAEHRAAQQPNEHAMLIPAPISEQAWEAAAIATQQRLAMGVEREKTGVAPIQIRTR